jgi:hypothetical protein
LARALAGPDPDPERLHQARIVAEMRIRLDQIAEAKNGLIKRMNIELPATKINFIYGLLSTRDWNSGLSVRLKTSGISGISCDSKEVI